MNNTNTSKGFRRICSLMGVPFDVVDSIAPALQARIDTKNAPLQVVTTPNPEILMKTFDALGYRDILAQADISLPDGNGLLWATSFLQRAEKQSKPQVLWTFLVTYASLVCAKSSLRKVIPHLHHGSDTFFALHEFWDEREESPRVFYFGGEGSVPEQMCGAMTLRFPFVNIVGSCGGYPFVDEAQDRHILETIIKAKPEIVFVALPFPKQERWIFHVREELQNAGVKMMMVVGGTFDVAVGKRKRVPKWMTRYGIEFLWRLLQEPQRAGRIFTAVFGFPFTILLRRLRGEKDLIVFHE